MADVNLTSLNSLNYWATGTTSATSTTTTPLIYTTVVQPYVRPHVGGQERADYLGKIGEELGRLKPLANKPGEESAKYEALLQELRGLNADPNRKPTSISTVYANAGIGKEHANEYKEMMEEKKNMHVGGTKPSWMEAELEEVLCRGRELLAA